MRGPHFSLWPSPGLHNQGYVVKSSDTTFQFVSSRSAHPSVSTSTSLLTLLISNLPCSTVSDAAYCHSFYGLQRFSLELRHCQLWPTVWLDLSLTRQADCSVQNRSCICLSVHNNLFKRCTGCIAKLFPCSASLLKTLPAMVYIRLTQGHPYVSSLGNRSSWPSSRVQCLPWGCEVLDTGCCPLCWGNEALQQTGALLGHQLGDRKSTRLNSSHL